MFLGKIGKRNWRFIICTGIILWLLTVIIFFKPTTPWKKLFTFKNSNHYDHFNLNENKVSNNINSKKHDDVGIINGLASKNVDPHSADFLDESPLLPTNKTPSDTYTIPSEKKDGKIISILKERSKGPLKFRGPQNEKQRRLVSAFMHAWGAYKKYAWGFDELLPISMTGHQWMGVGMTIVDSLDTMYIMGLEEEFLLSRDWVRDKLSAMQDYQMQFFEVVIRLLGGLLSAFHLSADQVFLDKAEEFGKAFKPCLKGANDLPCNKIITRSQQPIFSQTNLAEVGSIQLEFRDLSRLTKDPYYEQTSFRTNEHLRSTGAKVDGLLAYMLSTYGDSEFSEGAVSIGAMADSYYEYLLKQWLQTGKTIDWLKEHFIEAHKGALKHLIKRPKHANLTYVGIMPVMSSPQAFESKMEHLACFYPGLLALAHMNGIISVDPSERPLIQTAAELTETCYEMYHQMPTGLSPESVVFESDTSTRPSQKDKFYVEAGQFYNIHRPETIESLFYMYKATNDDKYRQWAWRIFEAFEKHTRLAEGYAGVKNVDAASHRDLIFIDKMETFYLAETLKYLYLMFQEGPDLLPLDQWVFNTEAHPLPVYRA